MDGWIKVFRQITQNPLWHEKPFSKGQAWIDLLILANHRDSLVILGNETVVIKRGQLHTSELKLSERWGWSRNKVRAYLKLLENQKMSTTVKTTKGTTITVLNYTSYQGSETTDDTATKTFKGHQKDNEKTSKGTQTRNIKNEKNVKEGEREERHTLVPFGSFENVFLSSQEYSQLAETYNDAKKLIERLSQYKAAHNKEYRNDYAQLLSFASKDGYSRKTVKPTIEEIDREPMPEDIREKVSQIFKSVGD